MSPESNSAVPGGDHLLSPERLRWRCDPTHFGFETTAEMEQCPINIIGQTRAMEALELGLSMRSEGYNIFAIGADSLGMRGIISRFLDSRAAGRAVPHDWCYVSNFREEREPKVLQLPAGQGVVFEFGGNDVGEPPADHLASPATG